MERRGVSPVIATVLLVLIAIVLASIIMVWAKSFIGERAQKQGEPIEASCSRIVFEAEAFESTNSISIVNRGNVPIYGIEIRKKGFGSEIKVGLFQGTSNTIDNGEDGEITLEATDSISAGDELVIVPIILGEFGDETKAYTCDVSEKSEEIIVR